MACATTLAKIVKRYNGHLKTKDMPMKAKWELILTALKSKDEFLELKILSGAVAVKFHRDQEKVLEKFQISKEGANLSGLPNVPSPYEHLHLSMAEEAATKEKKRKRAMKINSDQKKNIEFITASQLMAQGTISSETSPDLSDVSSDLSNGATAASFIYKLTEQLTATFANSNDTEDKELDRRLKKIQIEAAETQMKAAVSNDAEDRELDRILKKTQIEVAMEQMKAAKAQKEYYLKEMKR